MERVELAIGNNFFQTCIDLGHKFFVAFFHSNAQIAFFEAGIADDAHFLFWVAFHVEAHHGHVANGSINAPLQQFFDQ